MQCRACGMESRTNDFCEWCKKPTPPGVQPGAPMPGGPQPTLQMPPVNAPPPGMPPGAQPTIGMPPGTQPTTAMPPVGQPTVAMPPMTARRRVALTGEVIEDVTAAAPPPMMPGAHPFPTQGAPNLIPPTGYSAQAVQAQLQAFQPTLGERWEKALALCLPILALSMLLVHFFPNAVMLIAYANVFFLPMALGAARVIPTFDEAYMDCTVVLIVSLFFGPLAALLLYGIVCLIKQECNGAMIALLVVCMIVPPLLLIPLIHSADSVQPFRLLSLFSWLSFIEVVVAFVGWMFSSFFIPENE